MYVNFLRHAYIYKYEYESKVLPFQSNLFRTMIFLYDYFRHLEGV